jgi:hyperosmotically inducible periplasmic protein
MASLPGVVVRSVTLAALLLSGASGAWAQQPAPADNTKVNQQERNNTADQQKENASDRELTQNIRKAIMQDKSLSTYAHNVKIISQNGTVTLKGPVHSDDEKQAIEAKAAEVAGKDKVVSDLTVVPSQK